MAFQENKIFEKKEEQPKYDLKADWLRHGEPEYTEVELKTGQAEGKLTDLGRQQVALAAEKLVKGIDLQNELVVIWSSPKGRAQQTTEIVEEVFRARGVKLIKTATVNFLRDVGVTTDFLTDLRKQNVPDLWQYWSEITEKTKEGVETPKQVRKRVENVIAYLERFSRVVKDKKVHFICIGHEEIFNDLLAEAFGSSLESLNYAEILNIGLIKSSEKKEARLDLTYRQQTSILKFNKDNRNFSRI